MCAGCAKVARTTAKRSNMSKLTTLSKAIAEYVNDGDTVYAAGFHPPDPVRRGARNHSSEEARPGAGTRHAGPDLRSDGGGRLRAQSHLFLHGQSGRGLAAHCPKRHRAGQTRMGGVLALSDDHAPAGRRLGLALPADEPDRRRQIWRKPIRTSSASPTPTAARM